MPELAEKQVGSTGFGLMGFTWRDQQTPDAQAFDTMRTALSTGSNFWNGGEFYGPSESNSLHLLKRYFTKYPDDADRVVLSIKGGANPDSRMPEGDPKGLRRSVDECLKQLDGTKKLDLMQCARVDPKTPIEVTVRTLAEYVKECKVGGIGLSECSANTIRRAAKVHPIAAVEVEFSLFSTDILKNGVAETCGELGIPIIAYSPLGRGFLTNQIKSVDDIPAGDMRRHQPRFQPGNLENNLKLVEQVGKIAERKGCTTSQIAVAWVKAYQHKPGMPTIIPIPGATKADRVRENNTDVQLSESEMKELDDALERCEVAGGRYPDFLSKLNFGDTPPEE